MDKGRNETKKHTCEVEGICDNGKCIKTSNIFECECNPGSHDLYL